MTHVQQARLDSQMACRLYVTTLQELLDSIWWRPRPLVVQKLETAEMHESWSMLSPMYFLTTIMPYLYNGETDVSKLHQAIANAEDLIVISWNQLLDVFRWTPKDLTGTPPVFWKFPQLVNLAQLYAEAMLSFHLYIYASMAEELESDIEKEFFKVLQLMNQWVGAFKRTWQRAEWVDKTFEEVKPVVRRDVQVQLDRLPRPPTST